MDTATGKAGERREQKEDCTINPAGRGSKRNAGSSINKAVGSRKKWSWAWERFLRGDGSREGGVVAKGSV